MCPTTYQQEFALKRFVMILLCVLFPSYAQATEGISNALLNVPSAGVLQEQHLEYSPTFKSGHIFDTQDQYKRVAQMIEFSHRLTIGLSRSLELGFNIPFFNQITQKSANTFLENIGIGTKWNVLTHSTWQLSVYGGVQVPIYSKAWLLDAGFVATWRPHSQWMVDMSVTPALFHETDLSWGGRYDVGVGYEVVPGIFQLLAEWSHTWQLSQGLTQRGVFALAANINFPLNTTLTLGVELDAFHPQTDRRAFVFVFSLAYIFDTRIKRS